MRKDNDVYNRILKAAYKLFEEKGYQAATTREIAELAGISRGHLRYYFAKKEELFYSYFSELRDRKWQELAFACEGLSDTGIFALLLLRSYVQLICSFSSAKDLETLQSYEIVSKYENRSEAMSERISKFAKTKQKPADSERLSASVEIAGIVMYKFAFDRMNQRRRAIAPEDIWEYSARHGLFSYGVESTKIETLLSDTAAYIEAYKLCL